MGTNQKTILIVDDEEDTRVYFSSFLEDNGYLTLEAEDGEEGMQLVRENKVDLITLDMAMPTKSGVGLYRELKESEEWKHIPIIIITGLAGDFRKFISSRSQAPPPEGYMSKPINQEEFIRVVEELVV